MAIVSAILPPWKSIPISGPVRKELERRKLNYGINYVETVGNKEEYKGPRRIWIRCVSNAIVNKTQGFKFINEQDGFTNDYGFYDSSKNQQIIGKDLNGKNHFISSIDHRPVPGVVSIDLTVEKSIYRKAQIKWKCFSVEQLDYIGKYFFRLYSTVALEWGWNNIGEKKLLDLNIGKFATYENGKLIETGSALRGAYTDPNVIENLINSSNGNYDAMIGHITKWDYRYESDLSFTCTTEIASNSRIVFGLSMFNLTKDSNDENKNPTSPFEYFQNKFESELRAAIADKTEPKWVNTGVSAGVGAPGGYMTTEHSAPSYKLESYDINVRSKIFSFEQYKRQKLGMTSEAKEANIFITFGLFCEVLNQMFINDKQNNGSSVSINIENAIIGAHLNMISTNKDIYLIPNASAPYFNVTSIMDNSENIGKNLLSGSYIEEPLSVSSNIDGIDNLDKQIKDLYGVNSARQDLHSVLTYFGSDKNEKTCFPRLTDDENGNNKFYYGYIKDIFLNLNFIKTCVSTNSKTLEDLLTSICEGLNKSNSWWRLEPTIDTDGKTITIIDQNYKNLDVKNKVQYRLNINDPFLYLFEPYTQNSILKEFNFDVRISDAVATQIVNSISSKLNSDDKYSSTVYDNGFTTQYSPLDDPIYFDRLIDKVKTPTPKKNKTTSGTLSEKLALDFEKIRKFTSEKNDETLSIVQQTPGNGFKEVENKIKTIKKYLEQFNKPPSALELVLFSNDQLESADARELAKPIDVKKTIIDTLKTRQSVIRLALPKNFSYLNQKATFFENQENFPNRRNMPIPNAEVSFTIEGIGGIKTFQIFGIKNLPSYYRNSVIFQIKEISHTISQSDGWNTKIIAAIIPVGKNKYEELVNKT